MISSSLSAEFLSFFPLFSAFSFVSGTKGFFMAITEEKSLMTSEKFNRGVENWTWKVRNTSVNILQRTHATGRLRRELQSRWLKDREGGPAYVGLGFRFARYGAYREYGAGRGYIVKNGIIMKDIRHGAIRRNVRNCVLYVFLNIVSGACVPLMNTMPLSGEVPYPG